jgi:hydroxypyruvate isomerase
MPKFSANLGFLWTELTLPKAIHAAKEAGFEAVECHFPYDLAAAEDVAEALNETGLNMLGINTRLGINGPDDFGVLAMPGREEEAQGYIDEAIAYGNIIGVKNINCVPGRTGRTEEAETVYRQNLTIAAEKAAKHGIGLVIEPINHRLATNFHCGTVEQAIETIKAVGVDNLKVMFDFYHTQIEQGDLLARIEHALPYVGHIQFAAIHDRGEPDVGEINYPYLLSALDDLGWDGFVGAEYRPRGTTEEGLGWMQAYA